MGSRKRYCVFGCGDQFGASMHMFPHPVKRASMFQQWMKQVEHKLQETDQIRIFRNKRMCDYHFEPMYKTTGHRLSINAVPTLHLDGFFESQARSSEQEHAYRIPTYNIDEIWDPETGLQTSSDGTVVPGTEATASASGDTSQNVDIGAFYENFLDNETESRTDDDNATAMTQQDDAAEAAGPFSWQNDAATVPDTEELDTIPVAAKPACPAPPARSVLHADPLEESLYDETPLHKDTRDTYSVSGAGEREQHLCCNVCAGAVTGFRYTCVQCADYDLCAQCEARAAHAHHYMLRVPGPRPYDEVRQILDSVRRILNDGFVQISADQIKEEVKEEEADPFSVVEDVFEDVTGAEGAASPPVSHHPDPYEESDDDINRSPPHSPHQTQPNTTTKSLDSPIVMHKIVVIPNHEQTNPKNLLKPEENILEIDCRTINTEIVDPKLLLSPKVILDKIVVLPITEPMTLINMPSEKDENLRTQGNMQKIVMQSSHNDKPPVSSTSMRKQTLIRSDDRTKHLPMHLTGDQMKYLTLQGNTEIAMRPNRHRKPTPVLETYKRKQTLITSDDQTTRYIKRTDDQAKSQTRQANTHKVAILSHNNKKPTPVSSMAEQTLITSADEMKRLPVNHTAEKAKFLTRLDNKQVIVMRPTHSEAKPTPITSTAKQTLKTLTTAQMKLLPMNLNDQAKFKRVVLSPAQAKLLNLSRLQPKSLVNISDEDRKRLKPVKFSELVKLGGKKMEQIVKVTAGPSLATMAKPTAEQGVCTSLSIETIGASTKRKLNVKFQKPSKIRIIQLNNSNKTEPSHSKIKDLQKGKSNNEV